MTSWELVEAGFDAWRTAAPPEPRFGWDEFARWVDENPDTHWELDNEDHLTAFIEMMEREVEEARADATIDRIEADRDDDDRDYWGGL
jgi:hypothetical protein